MRHALLTFLLFTGFAHPTEARDAVAYERWLIPLVINCPTNFNATCGLDGANGSAWATTLWLRNDGNESLDVFPISPADCPVSVACRQSVRAFPAIPPHATAVDYAPELRPSRVGPWWNPTGAFLWVQKDRADGLSAELHLHDARRSPNDWTRIPIVSEGDFFRTIRSIAAVPMDTGGRVALRVYGLDPGPAEVAVRIFDAAPGWVFNEFGVLLGMERERLLAEGRLQLAEQPQDCGFWFGCPTGLMYRPTYGAIMDLAAVFPGIKAAHSLGIRIEIEPVTPTLSYWPMVTVANNDSNHTTVYTVR